MVDTVSSSPKSEQATSENPLGSVLASPAKYSPQILFPIPRAASRSSLGISADALYGFDHWQAFELSWLEESGKPCVCYADLFFDAKTPAIVESKSLKLYLNSFNHERFESMAAVREVIAADLSHASGGAVDVALLTLADYSQLIAQQWASVSDVNAPRESSGLEDCAPALCSELVCLDSYPIQSSLAALDESVLSGHTLTGAEAEKEVRVTSDLFRSNCPVTNQPDWASIEIRYSGVTIDPSSLLSYLCSYRDHQGYHEECAERIFSALSRRFEPLSLRVSMNYLRRGGLDINVYRANCPLDIAERRVRGIRQ